MIFLSQIFSESSLDEATEKLQPDYILEYFSKFPIALQKYLEFLVFQKKLDVSSFTFCAMYLIN